MFDRLRLALIRRLEVLSGSTTPPSTPLAFDPDKVEALRLQGNSLIAEEKYDAAERVFREALVFSPDDTKLLVCLGFVLKEQSRFAEARIVLRRAAAPGQTTPQAFEAHYLMGEICERQNDLADAIRHFTAALDMTPDFIRACDDVLRILQRQGKESEASAFLEKLVLRCPSCVEYRLRLAKIYTESLQLQGTVNHLMAAVALGVNEAPVFIILGAALCRLEREEDSRKYFEFAEMVDPSVAYESRYHRGYAHTRSGNTHDAVRLLNESIELQPDFVPSHSQLLLNLSHAATELNWPYQQAAERFAQAIELPEIRLPLPARSYLDARAKHLRIGFVAGEFREHPVLHFLVGVLEQMDRSQFHLVAFSNNQSDDAATNVFKRLFADWYEIKDLSYDAVAELVRAQDIDVLVDLSGHTGDARLPVFARKPALVQVAWLGYFASTGLKTMDYIIADSECVPIDSQEWFSETVVRLPDTRLCMTVPKTTHVIPVSPAPCTMLGYITFGSFQQATKISGRVLRAWAEILASVPQSRLRYQNKATEKPSIRDRICADMVAAGIDLARVDLVGDMDVESYFDSHKNVDILLDTFPYPGGTTTAFALWMGVPTVTLAGNTMLSLQGAAMLRCVGLSDWIAKDVAEYVEIARRFANDTDSLKHLRAQLRDVAVHSPLFDCARFATNLQNAFRFMYQEKLNEATAKEPI